MSSILVTIRSPKFRFTGLSKKLPTDFDEILWRAGVWPSYILVMIRITVQIWELVPDHDADLGRTATMSIMLAFGGGLCCLLVVYLVSLNNEAGVFYCRIIKHLTMNG